MVNLRLDSWSAEYGTSQEFDPGEEPKADVGLDVETGQVAEVSWERPVPAPVSRRPELVAVIDGTRRVHARLFAEEGDTSAPALAGSWAVGVAYAGAWAAIGTIRLGRELIVGGSFPAPSLEVRVGEARLVFGGRSVPETDPKEIQAELQRLMRRAEAELARDVLTGSEGRMVRLLDDHGSPLGEFRNRQEADLALERLVADDPSARKKWRLVDLGSAPLVVRDGPLAYMPGDEPVVGLIKQRAREYLSHPERRLVSRLAIGERTPMFALKYGGHRGEQRHRWSWYMRLGPRLPIEGAEVGVVRLELPLAVPLAQARALADRAACALPRLASDRLRDGRAPQNLYPIGRLEEQLHRRLGTRELVARRLIGRVAELATASSPDVLAQHAHGKGPL